MKLFLKFTLAMMVLMSPAAMAEGTEKPLTVVELYTSQGCSSCPPADANLGRLAKRPDILALSFHVDYWDYIGWRDPFADPRHKARQQAYSEKFAQRYVYTPQVVVHGAYQVVGSQADGIENAIAKARGMPRVAVSLTEKDGSFEVALPAAPGVQGVEVLVVFFDRQLETDIQHGENAGRKLTNHNVVRDFRELGRWHGEATTMTFKNPHGKGEHCAVILQSATSGHIVGAAKLGSF